ncbi:MAG: MinD/ParA family protein [Firmicutes bacterium]|nr:MinD/ParA family protein [Bacillota bacterium]
MDWKSGPKDQAERLRQLVENGGQTRRSKVIGGLNNQRYVAEEQVFPETGVTRVIAVTSGKGGVGKTNFAVNLGVALAQGGRQVALLDADLGLANIDIVLGIIPQYTLVNVLRGEKTLPEIIVPGPGGLQVMAGGSGVYELANVSAWRLDQLIKSFGELEKSLDFFLIDTGAGIGQHVLAFLKSAEETVVVTTPEPTAVTDAYGLIKMLLLGSPEAKVKVVVNMVESEEEARQVYARLDAACSKFLGVQVGFLGYILRDRVVEKAVKEQIPFVVARPNSKAARCILEIAGRIASLPQENANAGGLRAMFKKMMSMVGS